ncbi:MAG: hypothetical protein QOG23_5931, partial [Blastocatellia bacterium]|nr:hypothetical protein [Blastocatellia bacterium]
GTSQEGFQAEWRESQIIACDGDLLNRCELFDEADLDVAITRFDQMTKPAPQLENAASRANARFIACVNARDWDASASLLAEDHYSDDRRRVTGAGTRRGRDADIESMRVLADLGANITVEVIATRGDRIALTRNHVSFDQQQGFLAEVLGIVETDLDGRIAAAIVFDLEDIDIAIAELDARYLAGEAAAYAHTWSVIVGAYAALNRREVPATTTDFASIDHRRGATFAPGDLVAYVRAAWDLSQDGGTYVDAVHRLSNLGAIVTHVTYGSFQEGFDAEWREVFLLTVEGEILSRCELFDEADLDAAIARFEQLSRPVPQLKNAASQVAERFGARFSAHDWDALADLLADDFTTDDRRRVVGAGVRKGREAEIASMRVVADLGGTNMTSTVIATRGARLILTRLCYSGWDQAPDGFRTDVLDVIEIDADDRLLTRIVFEPDDIDAAIAELDARYLAGEAALYADTWSIVAASYAALNRHELPPTTPGCLNIDHRRETAFGPGDVTAYISAGWDLNQDINIHVEEVHRLSSLGAIITYSAHETSREGFDAEWRGIALLTVEGEMVSRCEVFDEADLNAAIATFDGLTQPRPRLENAASRVDARYWTYFAARDWNTIAEILAEEFCIVDHRRVLNAGVLHGRDVQIENMKAIAEMGANITSTVIATRGQRLALARVCSSNSDLRHGEFGAKLLSIVGLDDDNRIAVGAVFDVDDLNAAFEELDARYLAGEAVAHSRTWSAIARALAASNRHELPPTTPDCVSIDHRRGIAFQPGDIVPYIRATWDVAPHSRTYFEAVHRLSDHGAVLIQVVKGTSPEGFAAEWREIVMAMVDGDLINHLELFDEADVDAAIASFEELRPQTQLLENAAGQVAEQFLAHFAARDWSGLAETLADNFSSDDRRRVVGAGVRHGRDAEM